MVRAYTNPWAGCPCDEKPHPYHGLLALPFGRISLNARRITPCDEVYDDRCPILPRSCGQRIRKARLEARVSFRRLALRLNVSMTLLRAWEEDRAVPVGGPLARVISWLDIDPRDGDVVLG